MESSEQFTRQPNISSELRPKFLSPFRIFIIILLTVFLGEVAVMIVLASLPEMPTFTEALLDGVMITLITTPALLFFLIRPLALHIDRREIAEEKLRVMNDVLEERVEARTAELLAANEHLKKEIEERTAAEKQLSKSAEFLNQILVAAPCVLAIYDVNTMKCSFINDRVTDLLGYSPDEVLLRGASFFEDVFSAETFDTFRNLNNRISAGIEDEIMKCVCELRTADNELLQFGIGLVSVKNTPGNLPKDILLAAVPSERTPYVGHSETESNET